MFDNPTDNHTDMEVPLYYELRFTKLKNPAILNLETCAFMITHKHYGQVFLSTQCHHILCCGNAVAVCANSSYDRDGIFQLIWSITH